MENLLLMGKDLEHLIELLTLQHQHNTSINTETLYDEITTKLKEFEGSNKIIVSYNHVTIDKPTQIQRTNNFQFIIDGSMIAVANKYF